MWNHSSYCVVDEKDEAPAKLTTHFRQVLEAMRNYSWQHYLPEKLATLKCFYPQQMASKRGFQHPNPLWLGPTLLARAVSRLYHTLRHVYYIYRTQRHVTSIYTHFNLQLRGVSNLPRILLERFPELKSNLRVARQKRKRVVVTDAEEHALVDVTLQGATGSRYVAILCWYDDDRASWLALDKQSEDVQSWWANTVEERYPLLLPKEYQVPLVLDRTGFSRSNSS